MAKTLEKQTVAAIEQALLTARRASRVPDLKAIAAIFACSYQSVCYIRRRLERHAATGIDDRKPSGRKPHDREKDMAEAIRELLERRPELDQAAVADWLYDEFGVRLCQASVSRIYKKNGIPHKISNRLYKGSKLFTSHPGGVYRPAVTNSSPKASPDPNTNSSFSSREREIAASALSELPSLPIPSVPIVQSALYRSPYAPTPEMLEGLATAQLDLGFGDFAKEDDFGGAGAMEFGDDGMPTYISPYS